MAAISSCLLVGLGIVCRFRAQRYDFEGENKKRRKSHHLLCGGGLREKGKDAKNYCP
ncbi:MAG: hypothetical protein IKM85_07355 [Bacteroidales bacterium]|nr:hypothetical protein [Bacteroidales bacterium]